jgi:putative ABC transport system permease protein
MIKHYLKVSFRNLWKYKSFSAINILGLAIGMATCLLILQYVSFKLSFDQFHKNADNIYRVANDRYQQGRLIQHGTITYSAVGKAMNDDYEEVVQNARVEPWNEVILTYNDKKLLKTKYYMLTAIFCQCLISLF